MRKLLLVLGFAGGVCAAVMTGCGSDDVVAQLSAEERFKLGMAKFKAEEYLEAIEDFKIVTLQYQGSQYGDDAQYYLAESRYVRGEYVLAAFEYDQLIRNLPTSEFVSRARFRKAKCYDDLSPDSFRDQEYTRKAIDEYQAFLEYYPADSLALSAEARIQDLNTKLAKKDYDNGAVYLKMNYNKAATFYFDLVLDKYHDTPFAELALLKKAEALTNRAKFAEARIEMGKFSVKYPSSQYGSEAANLRARIDREETDAKDQARRDAARKLNTVEGTTVQ